MKRSVALFALLLSGCAFLEKSDPTSWPAEKIYREAKDALESGQYDTAIKHYETLESRYPYGRLAQQAQLEIAYAYYKQSEQASAVAATERFIKLHPNHPNVDYAYYLKGLAYFNEDWGMLGSLAGQDRTERDPKSVRDSFEALKDLVQRYPQSRYAPDAIARMKYLVNSLAAYEIHVARYYMKREAYVAAVNRAQYVLKTFPQSPTSEEALLIMVKAYEALGVPQLEKDADRILTLNFPDSAHAKDMLSRLNR